MRDKYLYTKTSKASKNGRLGCRRFQKSTLSRFSGFSRVIRGNSGKYDTYHISWHCPNMDKYSFWPNTFTNSKNIYFQFFDSVAELKKLMFFGTFQPENFSTLSNFDAFEADAFEVLVYLEKLLCGFFLYICFFPNFLNQGEFIELPF